MTDVRVDSAVLDVFEAAMAARSGPVGAECVATAHALGSGLVQDALGNVSVVLTTLDLGLAQGSAALAREARAVERTWDAADRRLAPRAR